MEKIAEKNPGLKKIWMSLKNLDVLEGRTKTKNRFLQLFETDEETKS